MKIFFITLLSLFLYTAGTLKAAAGSIDVTMSPTGDVVTLPDGSTLQPYVIDDTRWFEFFKLDSIVGQQCWSDDNCVLLSPNGVEIKIDWQQVAVVATIVIIRVAQPKWLPKWATGRSANSSNPVATAVGGGGTCPPACGAPGAGT